MSTMPIQKPGKSKQNYRTPKAFIAAVKRRFDITDFAIDFAADYENKLADTFCDVEVDALSIPD